MIGPSGGGRLNNWRMQGPNLGPIPTLASKTPIYENQTQRVMQRRYGGSGN